MQDRQIERGVVSLPVPIEVIAEAEINLEKDILQFTAEKGKIVVKKADTTDFVCDGDCENCPVSQTECDGDCENCPCCDSCD